MAWAAGVLCLTFVVFVLQQSAESNGNAANLATATSDLAAAKQDLSILGDSLRAQQRDVVCLAETTRAFNAAMVNAQVASQRGDADPVNRAALDDLARVQAQILDAQRICFDAPSASRPDPPVAVEAPAPIPVEVLSAPTTLPEVVVVDTVPGAPPVVPVEPPPTTEAPYVPPTTEAAPEPPPTEPPPTEPPPTEPTDPPATDPPATDP